MAATVVAIALALTGLVGAGGAPAAAAAPDAQLCGPAGGASDSFTVTGWVTEARSYDRAALDALPQTTVADTYRAGTGTTSRNYTGVDLAQLLELPSTTSGTGPLLRPHDPTGPQGPGQRNDVTRYSVMVTGSDCFQAVFAMTEVSPFFGGRPVLVATAQGEYDASNPSDPAPVTGPLGEDGFARISNPVDVRGSRRVSNIVEIRVLPAPAATATPPAQAPTCAGGTSEELTVSGHVSAEQTYDAARLADLPQRTVADTYLAGSGTTSVNYTGVELWRLLGLSETDGGIGTLIRPNPPGPQAPEPQRNDLTRYSVMVTATDCFQALFSLAEISPFFGGRPVLLATAQGPYDPADLSPETGSLGSSGFARISNPVDRRGSRRVSNIVDIRVLPTPTPALAWPEPEPILDGTPLGPDQLDATVTDDGVAVPGTIAYDPPAGTVLPVGTHELSALFVPAVPSTTTIARTTTTITVLPAPAPAATALSASPDRTIDAGRTSTVGTRLTSGGEPLADQPVELLVRRHGSEVLTRLATLRTDADGRVSRPVSGLRRSALRWRFAGAEGYAATDSPASLLRVRARVALQVERRSRPRVDAVAARGLVVPDRSGATATLRLVRDGEIGRRLASAPVGEDGRVRLVADLPARSGPVRVVLVVPRGEGNLTGRSPVRRVLP